MQEKIHHQNLEEVLQVPTPKSDYVKGLAMLHSAIRGSTNGETIRAPLAGYCLRGNLLFRISHQTVVLPLNHALSYLENKQISATVSQKGVIRATIYDYVFRTKSVVQFDNMNYWVFLKTQEFCKNKSAVDKNQENEEEDQYLTENADQLSHKSNSKSTARIIRFYSIILNMELGAIAMVRASFFQITQHKDYLIGPSYKMILI